MICFLDLGVIVGKNTPYKYLVVNIHYLPIVKNDYSGTQIIFGRKRLVDEDILLDYQKTNPIDYFFKT